MASNKIRLFLCGLDGFLGWGPLYRETVRDGLVWNWWAFNAWANGGRAGTLAPFFAL
ncbi:MAG: hypothetical protein AAGD22_10085 [Verrucomicrobiota bacterium]